MKGFRLKLIESDGVTNVSVEDSQYSPNGHYEPQNFILSRFYRDKTYKRGTILNKLKIWGKKKDKTIGDSSQCQKEQNL